MKQIPPLLLRRLNRGHRHRVLERIERIEQFNRQILSLLDLFAHYFPTHPFYRRPLKLLYVHTLATFGTLALMPSAHEMPPVAILVVFASSFCLAYSLTALRIV